MPPSIETPASIVALAIRADGVARSTGKDKSKKLSEISRQLAAVATTAVSDELKELAKSQAAAVDIISKQEQINDFIQQLLPEIMQLIEQQSIVATEDKLSNLVNILNNAKLSNQEKAS